MVQVVQGDTGWSDAFEQIGKGVSEGYTTRSDEMAIQNALTRLPENATMKQRLDAILGTKTYRPDSKQNVIKNLLTQEQYDIQRKHYEKLEGDRKAKADATLLKDQKKNEEEEKKRTNTQFLASKLDLPEEEKVALGESGDHKTVEKLYTNQIKKAGEPDEFEKALIPKMAEEYINLTKDIPKIEDSLRTIDKIEEVSKELGVGNKLLKNVTAPLSGLIGTEKAKELEAISFTALDPIIKIFNPTGPIAARKIELLKDIYHIKPTDLPYQIQGKIKALRFFSQQALNRANKRLELFNSRAGKDLVSDLAKFDKETETLTDAMIDYDFEGKPFPVEEAKRLGLPDPVKDKGRSIKLKDGTSVVSDGTKWVIK